MARKIKKWYDEKEVKEDNINLKEITRDDVIHLIAVLEVGYGDAKMIRLKDCSECSEILKKLRMSVNLH